MATLARAFAPVASGSGNRTPNPSAVAREVARRPVRASSPRFDGAGGVRGVVGNARGAAAPARAAGGGAEVPSAGGEPKRRRGKNRRRAPRKNDGASDKVSPNKVAPSSAAAALAIAASVDPDAATIARFMGTLDESDAGADGGGSLGAKKREPRQTPCSWAPWISTTRRWTFRRKRRTKRRFRSPCLDPL
jgi:hypothetical protein